MCVCVLGKLVGKRGERMILIKESSFIGWDDHWNFGHVFLKEAKRATYVWVIW